MSQYLKTDWKNSPSQDTPIDASKLNRIENALSFSINRATNNATLNADWSAGDAVGLEFNRIADLVISNFAATINNVSGMHLFIGAVPEGFRPSRATPFPAVFVPAGSTDYEPRIVVVNPDGTIQIAKNPTVTGTFFCAMVYFVE